MLSILACLVGVFGVLVIAEILWRARILKGEYQRKFVHILTASFVAFWPWLVDWHAIEGLGVAMLAIVAANHLQEQLHFSGDLRKKSVGGFALALVITIAALMTHNKIFFAIAILNTALADGLAAVFGTRYGKNWEYKIFGYPKTVIGTMTFWLVSLLILGVGLLFVYTSISSQTYVLLLLFLPPTLAAIENIAVDGVDNIAVPIAALLALKTFS